MQCRFLDFCFVFFNNQIYKKLLLFKDELTIKNFLVGRGCTIYFLARDDYGGSKDGEFSNYADVSLEKMDSSEVAYYP